VSKELAPPLQIPTLRHGAAWIYYFPVRRQVTVRCPKDDDWTSHT